MQHFRMYRLLGCYLKPNARTVVCMGSSASRHSILRNCYRCLYTPERLGLDRFEKTKYEMLDKLGKQEAFFRERLREQLMDQQTLHVIFTEDLKIMLHISSTIEDLEIIETMIRKLLAQDRNLSFHKFNFGPVAMRLLYSLRDADKAYKLFMEENLRPFFDQASTSVVLMDLLLVEHRYKECFKVFEAISSRRPEVPWDCVTLVFAAGYYWNTEEALERVTKIIDQKGIGQMTARSRCFGAALALNQGKYEMAYSLVSNEDATRNNQAANIHLQLYCKCKRIPNIFNLVEHITFQTVPPYASTPSIYRDTFEQMKSLELELEEGDKLQELLVKAEAEGRVSHSTLKEKLSSPIRQVRSGLQQGFKHRQRAPPRAQRKTNAYPGFSEMLRE